MRPADWPANGRYSSPRPASTASRIRAPVVAGSSHSGCTRSCSISGVLSARGSVVLPRPRVRRHHALAVGDLDGVERVGLDDAALPLVGDAELGRGQEARAHAHALRAERERRGQPAAVGDPAGRDHGDVAGHVDHLRDEHHRRHPAAVTARLAALGDDDVGAGGDRLLGLAAVDDLLDPAGCRRRGRGRSGPRVRPCGRRSRPERPRAWRRTRSSNGRLVWLIANGGRSARAAAATAPQLGHVRRPVPRLPSAPLRQRRGEVDLLPRPERGADDRRLDAEQSAEGRAEHAPIIEAAGPRQPAAPARLGSFSVPLISSSGAFSFGMKPDFMPK